VASPITSRHLIHPASDNIRYDLLRSGSVEITSNKILERGHLDPVRVWRIMLENPRD
jgi:hypothetical protein